VAPARVSYEDAPAVYKTVHETVVVKPAGVTWQRKHDWHGRETMCKVHTPAVTQTVAKQVMVSPPSRIAHQTPAVYEHQTRKVLAQAASTRHVYEPPVHQWVAQPYVARPASQRVVHTPALVAMQHRQVLVREGGYAWQRSGHHW
jgi:hypothetical protein